MAPAPTCSPACTLGRPTGSARLIPGAFFEIALFLSYVTCSPSLSSLWPICFCCHSRGTRPAQSHRAWNPPAAFCGDGWKRELGCTRAPCGIMACITYGVGRVTVGPSRYSHSDSAHRNVSQKILSRGHDLAADDSTGVRRGVNIDLRQGLGRCEDSHPGVWVRLPQGGVLSWDGAWSPRNLSANDPTNTSTPTQTTTVKHDAHKRPCPQTGCAGRPKSCRRKGRQNRRHQSCQNRFCCRWRAWAAWGAGR